MERKEIKEVNSGIQIIDKMIRTMKDNNQLQLDRYFLLEMIKNEEEITFSNVRNELNDEKLMTVSIVRTYKDIKITFTDWTTFTKYKIRTTVENEKAVDLFNFCKELAKEGELQTMEESISRILNIK